MHPLTPAREHCPTHATSENRVLENRYRIRRKIGRGRTADVYLGDDLLLERTVTIKILRPSLSEDSAGIARFRHEATTLAAVRSPHVVGVYDIGISGDCAYLVMQHIEGQTIEQETARHGPMSAARAEKVLVQLLTGLSELHSKGVVHRDIRASNVLLDRNQSVVLLDLGILLETRRSSLLPIPPESDPFTSDVYHVGMIMLFLLTGIDATKQPLRSSLEDVIRRLPPALMPVARRALEIDPARRFPTATAMKQATDNALGTRSIYSRPDQRPTATMTTAHLQALLGDSTPTAPFIAFPATAPQVTASQPTGRRRLLLESTQILTTRPLISARAIRSPSEYMQTPLIAPAVSRSTLLVVDDDPFVREHIRELLAPSYQICTTSDAAVAYARMEAGERFSVVLCGLTTSDTFYDHLVASYPDQAPALLVLPKPFDPTGLEELIRQRIKTARRAITAR